MSRYIVPPEEEWSLSEELEEFKRLTVLQEFELDSEATLLGYFIRNLYWAKYQLSPINLRQFYLDKAIKALPQINDQQTRKLLENLVYSKTKH